MNLWEHESGRFNRANHVYWILRVLSFFSIAIHAVNRSDSFSSRSKNHVDGLRYDVHRAYLSATR